MNDQPSNPVPDAPRPEPYPGFNEESRKREERIAAIEQAHATVLPGALRDAFAGDRALAGGHLLQPVTLGLTANLERIKSPLLEAVRIMREEMSSSSSPTLGERIEVRGQENQESSAPDPRLANVRKRISALKFEEEQIAETVFVFTRPQKRVRKLLDSGRDKFREAVMEELGDKLHPAQMAVLQRACAQHYVASFATIIGYGTPPAEEGAVVFPPPSPGTVTGSAGG